LERPTQIALINTHQDSIQLVDLGTSYSFRSLARGPEGEALVLGTDGQLRSIDPTTGEILYSVQVTEKWEEPEQWQSPRPSIFAQGERPLLQSPARRSSTSSILLA